MYLRLAAFILVAVVAALASRETADASLTISGTVFEDNDHDGVRDPGEPGMCCWRVEFWRSGELITSTSSGHDGAYTFLLGPGGYTITLVHTRDALGPCVDSFGGLSPLRLDDCLGPSEVDWPVTTDDSVDGEITDQPVTIDFGVREPDAAMVLGIALLNDGYPPVGTPVEAYVGAQQCGAATITRTGPGAHTFELLVLGEGEIAGCARAGKPVDLRVAGVSDTSVYLFNPGVRFTVLHHILAIPDHAWFWSQEAAMPGTSIDSVVMALVDGKACGDATVVGSTVFGSPVVGFIRLTVPSEAVEPGCGHAGAEVRFEVSGEPTGTVLPWGTAVQYADLHLPEAVVKGDLDCSTAIEATDALHILRWVAGLPRLVPDICPTLYDVDCGGSPESVDALYVLRWVASLEVSLPAGCGPIGRSGP